MKRADGRARNGGPDRGAGRHWLRVELDEATRSRIKVLTAARGWGSRAEDAARLIAEWAAREWAEYDGEVTTAAEWEGEVL